jgi:nucleotide-binding universal stress UspA family protein
MTTTPFRRVLVGWDCSLDAAAALQTAASIARDGAAHVVALAVLDAAPHGESNEDRARDRAERRRYIERLFYEARESVPAAARAQVRLQIVEDGDPARAVCDYAAEHGFDLLVLGRHGDGGVLHHRLGHVAEKAARAGKLPVLLLSDR